MLLYINNDNDHHITCTLCLTPNLILLPLPPSLLPSLPLPFFSPPLPSAPSLLSLPLSSPSSLIPLSPPVPLLRTYLPCFPPHSTNINSIVALFIYCKLSIKYMF